MLNEIDELSLENTMEEAIDNDWDNKIKTGIGKHWLDEAEIPNHVNWLIGLDRSLPAKVHFVKNVGERVCLKSRILSDNPDEVKCPYCEMPDSWDASKGNRAYNALLMLGYVFEAVGRVITPKDKETGKPKLDEGGQPLMWDDNPVKVLVLKRGKDDVNITTMKDLDREGELTSDLFELKKYPKKLKKAMSITLAHKKTVEKNKFKHLPNGCTVPKDVKDRFDSMDIKDCRGLMINVFCPNWDNVVLQKYCNKPEEDTKLNSSNKQETVDAEEALSNSK